MDLPPLKAVLRAVLACLAALSLGAPLPAAAAQWLLASPTTQAEAGKPLEVTVIAPVGGEAPERIPAVLVSGGQRLEAVLERVAEEEPGRRARYRLRVPAEVSGLIVLELAGRESTRLMLQVVVPSPIDTALKDAVAPPAPPPSAAAEPPSPSLQPHEPLYFIVGSSGPDTSARFQLSFKYRLFDPQGMAAVFLPGLDKFFFAYTQNSIWDLSGDSKPFRDTSYRPSFFYDWTPEIEGKWVSLRGGYEHESNGREGADSRSIDTLFVRPTLRFDLGGGSFAEISPKVWGYIDRDDNPDIAQFRGYADLTLRAGHHQGLIGQVHLRRGSAGKGSAQIDLSYRLARSLFADVGGFIHAQYFVGYGENILDYNVRSRPEFRLGFSIVR